MCVTKRFIIIIVISDGVVLQTGIILVKYSIRFLAQNQEKQALIIMRMKMMR